VPVEPFIADVVERMRAEWRSSRDRRYHEAPKTPALFEHEYALDLKPEVWRMVSQNVQTCLRNFFRLPLLAEIRRGFDRESRAAYPDSLLWLAERLLREPGLEVRVLAFEILTRVLPNDPERAWPVLRRAARAAHEWITVDTLAHAYGAGILQEPLRWSEIEQLAFSPSPWERRLVGSTIATIPFAKRREGRRPEIAERALPIIGNLIGDADPDVQKSLSWALRSMALVDPAALRAFAETESRRAVAENDGHRAWVVRDALPALAPEDAQRIRARLEGIRRRPGAASTSEASAMAARFGGLVETTRAASGPRTAADFEDDRTETRTGVTA